MCIRDRGMSVALAQAGAKVVGVARSFLVSSQDLLATPTTLAPALSLIHI